MVKPVKFARDSGCLARDKFLVISEGDHNYVDLHRLYYFFIVWHCIFTSYVGQ